MISLKPKYIHSSNQNAFRKMMPIVAALTILFIIITVSPFLYAINGYKDYLPLHSLLEAIAIVVAMQVAGLGWSAFSHKIPGNIVFLASIFFGVAILDFSHLLSYTGMPDYVTPSGPDKGIYFWLLARLLLAVGLLIFTISTLRLLVSKTSQYLLLTSIFILIGFMHWLILFHQELFPPMFIIGEGLTALKTNTEYAIIALNVITAVMLWRRMYQPQSYDIMAMFSAVCIMAMGELFFTFYADLTDIYNISGHIYKVIAYLFIYRAIFVTTVQKPFEELTKIQKQLHDKNRLLDSIVNNIPHMIFLKHASDLCYALFNKAGEELTGISQSKLLNHSDYEFYPKEQADFFIQKDRETLRNGIIVDIPNEPIDTPHGTRILHTKKIPIKDEYGQLQYLLGISEDITDRKNTEAHIRYLAHYDQLTGLPNRVMLNDRVTYLLSVAQRTNEPLAVMFLDLDHFKNINDTLGHTIGDYVLIEMAKRIKETIRDEDTVARLGGDEFIMLFPNSDSNAAMHIATKLITEISRISIVEHHELTITPSIGIAIYPNDGENFETLFKNADTAMYRVKNDSRNNFHFFTQEMQLNLARNLQLENALRHALERNELEVHYQPQIAIEDGRIIGAEALLRWHHPELGMISPAEFIPIAESSGQIIAIGEWVLRTAIQQTKTWMTSGFNPMIIAINLSAIQFRQNNLLSLVTDILEEAQLPSEYLELELTEAVTMHDPKSAIDIMNKFHEQGIRMSIDDFGTGYSSLSYLKQFKVYKLKIDQSFIRDISDDPDDRAIVSAIIDMAHNLGLQTIAEGVETAEQLAFLRLHGCNEVQGYYFSKPLPAAEFKQFLHATQER
ncbi:MAG: EAL domain-containing protein [Sulfuricurvum sp.]|nr:EAL domain-containing protein [Sulfuricurvum sp.]